MHTGGICTAQASAYVVRVGNTVEHQQKRRFLQADKQLLQGVTYSYWLEEVENGGGRTLYGPTRSAVIENVGDFWHFLPLIAR